MGSEVQVLRSSGWLQGLVVHIDVDRGAYAVVANDGETWAGTCVLEVTGHHRANTSTSKHEGEYRFFEPEVKVALCASGWTRAIFRGCDPCCSHVFRPAPELRCSHWSQSFWLVSCRPTVQVCSELLRSNELLDGLALQVAPPRFEADGSRL